MTTRKGRLNLGAADTIPEVPVEELLGATTEDLPLNVEPLTAAQPLDLGERFVDAGEIGRGGMGSVHRVQERSLARTVALKALSPELAGEPRVRERFLVEAQVTGQLEHPNIVPVYELGADDAGTFYFTMRLIRGQSLGDTLKARVGQPIEGWLDDVMEVFFRVCDALAFAHSRGVIHRDVKPSNIMVGDHGQVYLVDWGIALVRGRAGRPSVEPLRTTIRQSPDTREGVVVGTISYMSPEQARGEAVDERADVFGLGAVLYRIVTGRPPYVSRDKEEILALAQTGEVPDRTAELDSPAARQLLQVALKAMAPHPELRYRSATALRAAAQSVIRGRSRYEVLRVAAGERILTEGDAGREAYYIREGRCRVFRYLPGGGGEKQTLRSLGPGEVFGETAVFTGHPRNASVEAETEVELVVVPGSALTEALGLDSWMGAFVRSLGVRFSERSRRVTALQAELARSDLRERALAELARRRQGEAPLVELASALTVEVDLLEQALKGSTSLRLAEGGLVTLGEGGRR